MLLFFTKELFQQAIRPLQNYFRKAQDLRFISNSVEMIIIINKRKMEKVVAYSLKQIFFMPILEIQSNCLDFFLSKNVVANLLENNETVCLLGRNLL